MARRPSRASMCDWLSGALLNLTHIVPSNPADIEALARRSRFTEQRLRLLAEIASEMGYHVDADLDEACALIERYDKEN